MTPEEFEKLDKENSESALKAHKALCRKFMQTNIKFNIGNVISLREGGLMVPAIHDVEQMSLTEIMDAIRDISSRSRSRGGHLRSSELMDATITITSMGERGSDSVLGVIYPPQVAIIGFGKPRQLPQVRESEIVAILTAQDFLLAEANNMKVKIK